MIVEATVAKLNCPEPSVCKNWLAEPSACGYESPSKTTEPVPFGVSVISPSVFSEVIVLPSTLILSTYSTDHGTPEEPRGTELPVGVRPTLPEANNQFVPADLNMSKSSILDEIDVSASASKISSLAFKSRF